MQYFTLKVVGRFYETSDTVTVSFKQPGLKKIKYSAGQYLTLIFRINGRRYMRPYSFSSAPFIDADLEVTIKRVPGGIVSNHIIDSLKVGDIVEVMEPMGDFILWENNISQATRIVLWGAGSGITPLMSLAKYALHQNIASHVTLIYGNRNIESVIFNDKIEDLKKQFADKFSVWHFHTRLAIRSNNPYVIEGRISPHKVLSIMQDENNFDNSLHYICGPVGLKESVKTVLLNHGIGNEKIYFEDFEIARDPADFDEIVTREVLIKKGDQHTTVEVVKGKSILEAGLDAMIELSYSCQTGNCLVCKGRLIKGEVKMIGVKKLPDDLEQNDYLLCSSFPLTDEVEIEVD